MAALFKFTRYSCAICVIIIGLLCIQGDCDGSRISIKLLKTPEPMSNLDSPSFTFQVADTESPCSNCTTSCKLDDLPPSNCSSGIASYTKLQDGNHTFEVCINGSQSHLLRCASYNWTIDTVPPTASVAASTPFTNAWNATVYISFSEPCGGGGGGGFRCLSANDCSLLVYGAGHVVPNTLKTINPNLEYSILVNLSPTVEFGRVVLVTDKGFCTDAAGNQFTRTASSSFFLHFDRRNVYVDMRTRIPEQLLQLDNSVRLVQATNKHKNLKLYLYFNEPILNTSTEVLKSLQVSQGSLVSATGNNDSLGNTRFGFQVVDISDIAIVTARFDSRLVLSRQGTPVSPIAPVTFLFDSQRPSVRLSTTSHMRTRQEHIPVTIKFMKPVFGFNSSHLSISGGKMQGFRELSKSIYTLEIQPIEDMVLVQVLENVTTDVAGNKNLASNTLQLLHYSIPCASFALSCSATAAFVLTAIVAAILTVSTASLQNYGAFATPSPLLTSSPARILFRIVCHIQIFALSGWLAVPLPIEYSEFVKGLRWSIPYFRLPWETEYVQPVWPMNPHSYNSKTYNPWPQSMQLKAMTQEKAEFVYGLPLTAMEYKSFFESQNVMPEAEYIMDPNDSHGWRDFNRSMFWLAIISGGLITLHILFLLLLKLRKKKEKENNYISIIFPRFEIFLVILAIPCVSAASASLLKGGSASGIAVGILLLGAVFFLILALFLFLSVGISCGKLLQYKEVHQEDQKMHWYQALVKVTLGPGKRGQWTWINTSNSKWLSILGPLFEDLRGPPKYMLSQITGGLDYHTNGGSIIASDDENEDAEAPFVQKVFGILRIYYIFLESIKRVTLGIVVGTFSRGGYSETPTTTLICITSFQLFFTVLKKPFIKKKVQLVEIISVSCQLTIFAICLVLLRHNFSTHEQMKIGIAMLCLFLFAFVAQILNEWNSLICQIKQLDPDNRSLYLGLKIASWGILLLFVPIKLLKNIESQFPLKGQRFEDPTAAAGRFRRSDTPDRPWMKQLRDLAKSSFSKNDSSGTPTDPSSSRPKWSGFWSGKRSGSSSQATSLDSKSKPKGMYKDFEAIFGSKLEGKVALITGAASGIGECTAKLFVEHGAKVIIADIQDRLGQAVSEKIGSSSSIYVHCDVTNEEDVKNVVDIALATYGKLDIMFNNAGVYGPLKARIMDNEKNDFELVLNVNIMGVFLGMKHAARVMVPRKSGSIISTASLASHLGGMANHAYSCSKHAIVGLTKNLAVELGQFGIRVNCLSPYGLATPLATKVIGIQSEAFENKMNLEANLKGVTLKTDDIAYAALFLVSDEAKYITGHNQLIDGGLSFSNISLKVFEHPEDA